MKIAACVAFAAIGTQLPSGPSNTPVAESSTYDLTVTILPDEQRIDVSGTWTLPAQPVERSELQFMLSPKMEGLKVRLVEPSGPLELKSSQQDAGDMKWVYVAPSPIPAGVRPTLQVAYSSNTRAAPQFRIAPEGSLAGEAASSGTPKRPTRSAKRDGSASLCRPGSV